MSERPVDFVTSIANLYEISGIGIGCESGHLPVPVNGASAAVSYTHLTLPTKA